MNMRGYIRWQFEGTLTSPSFYGFSLTILALMALVAGCPAPWPQIMCITGFAVVMADVARCWFKFSYSIYENEQRQIMRELERKDR